MNFLPMCDCECDKTFGIGEDLALNNWTSKKKHS